MNSYALKLTPAMKRDAQWAIDPMHDYVDDEDCSYFGHPDVIPVVNGHFLEFVSGKVGPLEREATLDFLYRIERQLPDMAQAEGKPADAALRMADKIRWMTGITESSL